MPDKASVLSAMVNALDRLMTRIEGDFVPDAHRMPKGKRFSDKKLRHHSEEMAAEQEDSSAN